MRLVKCCLLTVAGLLLVGTASADVKPHPIFSDHMVLQQGVELKTPVNLKERDLVEAFQKVRS